MRLKIEVKAIAIVQETSSRMRVQNASYLYFSSLRRVMNQNPGMNA